MRNSAGNAPQAAIPRTPRLDVLYGAPYDPPIGAPPTQLNLQNYFAGDYGAAALTAAHEMKADLIVMGG